ncbi:uncharacterized protein LOC142768619 [Rhipicephalus microplus]|uniref:uncharacterized protein LOC142768619 n=1 Tax=Rhipicephalus microplus TaxID=6941 RepID=UPI003F6BBCAB
MLLILFVSCLTLVAKAQESRDTDNMCASGDMTGMDFFAGSKKQVMLQRTYNFTGPLNDSVCVQAPFNATLLTNNSLRKTFTYRNMSSTYKIFENSTTSFWPVGIFALYFYTENNISSNVDRSYSLNYVNSSMIYSAFGYYLPKPEWLFRYCDDKCAVLQVLSNITDDRDDKKCELWIRMNISETPQLSQWTPQNPCVRYFMEYCPTKYPTQVYTKDLCENPQKPATKNAK